ncbi:MULTISPECIES: hypothetical protein [Nocardiaceae]|uniref:DUF222 domain-containing protein n=1 Tax=Rhodococcoides corynebacterioides TaxID=53972 RepID=A0ABS2KNZ9_9NOCA|nr:MULTISPECIES: hypothetical protein [Rhodococcus]MBM7413699.1 hypothetical protein [Rhodococcus corynebacterioides]MBP1116162.1 hypothetical protein [Rhodococcus sp. PvP016]
MYDATGSVGVLVSTKVEAQASFTRTVAASCSYIREESRRPAVLGPGGVFDADAAEACAVAEVASALSVSTGTVTEWLFLTRTARPAVLEAFDAGRLAYAAFRTVCRSLAGFPNATEALLQRVVAAASRCTPGAVAAAIDRILADFDAEWHRIARERAALERAATVRKLPRDQAELKIRGPAEKVAGMLRAIAAAARGVTDPTSLPARLFDGRSRDHDRHTSAVRLRRRELRPRDVAGRTGRSCRHRPRRRHGSRVGRGTRPPRGLGTGTSRCGPHDRRGCDLAGDHHRRRGHCTAGGVQLPVPAARPSDRLRTTGPAGADHRARSPPHPTHAGRLDPHHGETG